MMNKQSSFIYARNLKEVFLDFIKIRSYLIPCLVSLINVIITYWGVVYYLERNHNIIYGILGLNIVLIALFSYFIIKDIYVLKRDSKETYYGSRFRYRLIFLFTIAAVIPVLLLGLFSSIAFRNAAHDWFDAKVEKAVNNAQNVAEAYLNEHNRNMRADIFATKADLEKTLVNTNSVSAIWGQLRMQLLLRDLGMIALYDQTGSPIIAIKSHLQQSHIASDTPYLQPSEIIKVHQKNPLIQIDNSYNLKAYKALRVNNQNYILHIKRPVNQKAVIYNDETKKAVNDYNIIKQEQTTSEIGFALIYVSFGILIIVFMVKAGQYFAHQLTRPLEILTKTALQIEAGDEMVRCPHPAKVRDEIDRLAIAFNQMVDTLSTEKKLTSAVLKGVTTGVICLDSEFKITLINQRALDIFKINDRQATELSELSSDFTGFTDILSLVKTPNLPQKHHKLYRLKNGDKVHLHMSYHLHDAPIQTIRYMITIDDVSELMRAQSAAAWQDIAQRIAHEIKNPLTPISLASERLERKWAKEIKTAPESFLETIAIIQTQVEHIQYTASSLSEFAKMPTPIFIKIDFYDLIKSVIQLENFRSDQVVFELSEHVPVYISGDERLLSQALINIFKNASEAILENQTADGHVHIRFLQEDDNVVIIIQDNGGGLPSEIPQHELFNPYVSTKDTGTGIGLAVTGKIIQDHGGKIYLQNAIDTETQEVTGTIVTIYLPEIMLH